MYAVVADQSERLSISVDRQAIDACLRERLVIELYLFVGVKCRLKVAVNDKLNIGAGEAQRAVAIDRPAGMG